MWLLLLSGPELRTHGRILGRNKGSGAATTSNQEEQAG